VSVRVKLPTHLRRLAGVEGEVALDVPELITVEAVLTELESRYPVLRGTIRDVTTGRRRAYVRYFACEQDLSHELPGKPLPTRVADGSEPFLVVGSMAGG
jgi:sulfur-carrier protein